MRYFKVVHAGAGRFIKDTVVAEDVLRQENWDLDGWIHTKAVVEAPQPTADEPPAITEAVAPHIPAAVARPGAPAATQGAQTIARPQATRPTAAQAPHSAPHTAPPSQQQHTTEAKEA